MNLKRFLFCAASALSVVPAYAELSCPLLETSAVVEAFDSDMAELVSADPSGICSWLIPDGGLLTVQVHKRPNASEAKSLFKAYQNAMSEGFDMLQGQAKLGQQSLLGTNGSTGQTDLVALDKDILLVLTYYAHSLEAADDNLGATIASLGQLAFERRSAADLSYGKCEWFSPAEAQRVLGKGKLTVHRLGPNHCLAWVTPSSAALTLMTDRDMSDQAFGNMRASAQEGCTVVDLPEVSEGSYATYACTAPADKAVSIQTFKNGTNAILTLNPGNRASTEADLKAIVPIAKHAADRL